MLFKDFKITLFEIFNQLLFQFELMANFGLE